MDLKEYIVEKKEDIELIEVKRRKIDFPENKNFVLTIIGPRRAGKTYSIYDFIKKKGIKREEYIFLNFEEITVKVEDVKKLPKINVELYGKEPKYIFLDEVQSLPLWEKAVYYLYEKKRYKIFVTGSTSKLLTKEIYTSLRGRTISVKVLPISFSEFLEHNLKIEKPISPTTESKIKNLLRKYLENGGFPDIVFRNVDKKLFFEEYINLVLFKDLTERLRVRNIYSLKTFLNYIFSIPTSFFSPKKVRKYFEGMGIKISRKTIYRYFDALLDSMVIFEIKKFSPSLKKEWITPSKVYFCDVGLANHFSEIHFGKLLENFVFLELMRKLEPGERISYWRDYSGKEVDFVIHDKKKVKMLIQVTYELNEENYNREIEPLIKASKELKTKNLFVLTWEQKEVIKENEREIKVIPIWSWVIKG